jgi:hypothetical protein
MTEQQSIGREASRLYAFSVARGIVPIVLLVVGAVSHGGARTPLIVIGLVLLLLNAVVTSVQLVRLQRRRDAA